MSSDLSVLLVIEVGETSPRQRTILRRELLRRRWIRFGDDGLSFVSKMSGAKTDRQVMRRMTRHVHSAVESAGILDWSANCVVAEVPSHEIHEKRPAVG